jgi:hypothetical protein
LHHLTNPSSGPTAPIVSLDFVLKKLHRRMSLSTALQSPCPLSFCWPVPSRSLTRLRMWTRMWRMRWKNGHCGEGDESEHRHRDRHKDKGSVISVIVRHMCYNRWVLPSLVNGREYLDCAHWRSTFMRWFLRATAATAGSSKCG